ncbi:MAG: F0F1 ATP synthase subunit B [Calditrichia bacterium]|nr:F0F1 ATP synthase subunit B [Calditrichia bacterium]
MLSLDPGVMIWAWITFVVLLFLLYKIAWKPILSAIDNREKLIQDSIEQAEKAKKESEELLEKHEKLIRNAEEEAQKIIKENKELAEKSRQELIEHAKEESNKLREKAKLEIEHEKESALQALRSEVVDLTMTATKKLIGDVLDDSKHRGIIENYIQKLPESEKN